jgi:hypothetical protein
VVDDEAEDYQPLLAALNELYVSCVHFTGNDLEQLPEVPFGGIRLLFQDLHLTGSSGKTAASHAASVFCKLVSTATAPIVVVIWSKYAADTSKDVPALPDQEDKTESQLFQETLLESAPEFRERILFVEMKKKRPQDRPARADWIKEIKAAIATALAGKDSVEALWQWEAVVQQCGIGISRDITALAHEVAKANNGSLEQGLKIAMQCIARGHAAGDLTAATAPRHLTSALSLLLFDHLETAGDSKDLRNHGAWLAEVPAGAITNAVKPKLNALLLTASIGDGSAPFLPGAIYKVKRPQPFEKAFGGSTASLMNDCFGGSGDRTAWDRGVKPVVIEITPMCDVAQGNRNRAMLMAGLIVPSVLTKSIKKGEAWLSLPIFALRWGRADFATQDASLVFCSRYRATLAADAVPTWLDAWFRIRDLPSSALRNWHSFMASRVGYMLV